MSEPLPLPTQSEWDEAQRMAHQLSVPDLEAARKLTPNVIAIVRLLQGVPVVDALASLATATASVINSSQSTPKKMAAERTGQLPPLGRRCRILAAGVGILIRLGLEQTTFVEQVHFTKEKN